MKKLIVGSLIVFTFLALASAARAEDIGDKAWAKKQVKFAKTQRALLLKHTHALGMVNPFLVPSVGQYTKESVRDWDSLGQAARNRGLYWRDVRIPKLHKMIMHPKGHGAKRWRPLLRYVGFPEYAVNQGINIINRESRGSASVCNSIGAAGLWQFIPLWYHGHSDYKIPAFNPYNPLQCTQVAYKVWKKQHRSFLPAWALTAY